jgi:uncharacterized protein (UPF0333 family)
VSERGQASVELVAALPALLVLALVVFQLLAIGYSAVLAGNAAEAGALALAAGGDARDAARKAVPGWSRAGMTVTARADRVEVGLRPPSALAVIGPKLTLHADAAVGSAG